MTTSSRNRWRTFLPGAVALIAIIALFFPSRLPAASGEEKRTLAAPYKFTEMPIAMPPGYKPTQSIREVNPLYHHIRSWVSSVGAGVALNDLTGSGRPDGMCIVDPRTDGVVLTYTPTAPESARFTPFLLDPAPTLPMDSTMAPMNCVPGDYNKDGRTDLLITYWMRTPVVFLAKSDARKPAPDSYHPVELIPTVSTDGRYHGPRWNTNAVTVGSFDGTGNPDIFLGNYYPDSDVLDPEGPPNVVMNASMSNAKNGGGNRVFRWEKGTAGTEPTISYVLEKNALPHDASTGWSLAAANVDLTGEGRASIYVANDFGKDHLFYNVSKPGKIKFIEAKGRRGATDPKSFVLGSSSFKGMGVDFGDLDSTGRFDIFVGNITTAWGLEESNFLFKNQAGSEKDMKAQLAGGRAPFKQDAFDRGLAFTGWSWDGKFGDFRNAGALDIVQASGFVKGEIDRWPWLQEMAMSNDNIYTNPKMWPDVEPGDDLAGDQPMKFWARGEDGDYVDLSAQLGLDLPVPSRGIATADTRGNGALDFAVARQWGAPAFYANASSSLGRHLTLNLVRPVAGAAPGRNLAGEGSPAYGATVQITTADGRTQVSQLDGGSGHSGRRSFQVRFGLGSASGPVKAVVRWSTPNGLRTQTFNLLPGEHTLSLTDSTAEEVQSR